MRDHPQPVGWNAERLQRDPPSLGVDDDAVEAPEQAPPQPSAPRRAAREKVVRGEDERRPRPEQRHVDLRRRQPLQVEHVGGAAHQPQHLGRVLDGLQRQPRPAADPARARIEGLLERVAVGGGALAEAERRRDELDARAGPGERGRELVVVRGREGGGIGEDDVHRRRPPTVPVASAPACDCSCARGTSSTGTPTRRVGQAFCAA